MTQQYARTHVRTIVRRANRANAKVFVLKSPKSAEKRNPPPVKHPRGGWTGRGQREKGRECSFCRGRGSVSMAGSPWNCKKPRQLDRAIYPGMSGRKHAFKESFAGPAFDAGWLLLKASRSIDREEALWKKRERERERESVDDQQRDAQLHNDCWLNGDRANNDNGAERRKIWSRQRKDLSSFNALEGEETRNERQLEGAGGRDERNTSK